eukprot:295738-Amphidinium_carterae.1
MVGGCDLGFFAWFLGVTHAGNTAYSKAFSCPRPRGFREEECKDAHAACNIQIAKVWCEQGETIDILEPIA